MPSDIGSAARDVQKYYLSYDDIHRLIQTSAEEIGREFRPTLMIAIGGGGFIPARIARTFLKKYNNGKNIPIQAIGLSLYEDLDAMTLQANAPRLANGRSDGGGGDGGGGDGRDDAEQVSAGPSYGEGVIGVEVVRTQWLDFSTLGRQRLLGHRILIVDEVDDTRTTLHYAVKELEKDIAAQLEALQGQGIASPSSSPPAPHSKTEIGIFVVNNKRKRKKADLPDAIARHYYVGEEVDDIWICYPWEAEDIEQHGQRAKAQRDSKPRKD